MKEHELKEQVEHNFDDNFIYTGRIDYGEMIHLLYSHRNNDDTTVILTHLKGNSNDG